MRQAWAGEAVRLQPCVLKAGVKSGHEVGHGRCLLREVSVVWAAPCLHLTLPVRDTRELPAAPRALWGCERWCGWHLCEP